MPGTETAYGPTSYVAPFVLASSLRRTVLYSAPTIVRLCGAIFSTEEAYGTPLSVYWSLPSV
eukprot:377831-Rhodomonas_salina.2